MQPVYLDVFVVFLVVLLFFVCVFINVCVIVLKYLVCQDKMKVFKSAFNNNSVMMEGRMDYFRKNMHSLNLSNTIM